MQSKLVRPTTPIAVPGLRRAHGAPELQVQHPADFIQTVTGRYRKAKWAGSNASGIKPVGDRILILADEAAPKSGGGIEFTDDQKERTALSAETGVLVDLGDDAFRWNADRSRAFSGVKPKAGDRVYFERYAGGTYKGKDGKMYRLMDDKSLGGIETA